MPTDEQPSSASPGRLRPGARLVGVAVALLVIAAAVAVVFATREDPSAAGAPSPEPFPPSTAAATTTTLDPRAEVVVRLKEILKVRDKAFQNRNVDLLSTVYTTDCPCLKGDGNAIKELADNNYHLIGGTTSVHVRRVERVTGELWLVIADFRSTPLRIETQSGELVRQEPAGNDLFQFAVAKPASTGRWLLGGAKSYQDG
jgi:hypothetical protein